jgi:hypothetical protein
MFDTDIEADSGSFSRTRTGLTLGLDYRFSDTVVMKNTLGYTYDVYNFSDTGSNSGGGGYTPPGGEGPAPAVAAAAFAADSGDVDPWGNVHTLIYNMGFDYKIDDAWTAFGGPMVGVAAEDGADWGDATIWGIAAGARYTFGPNLMVGLGIAGVQPIEDNFAVLPFAVFNWKISDQFALRSSRSIVGVTMGFAGVEGVWMFADRWELAVGAQAERSRFRLSDHNPVAPDGVGQVTGIPVYARLNWKASEDVTISGICGVIAAGNLEIDNKDGDKIGDDVDYDPAPFVGALISFRQ